MIAGGFHDRFHAALLDPSLPVPKDVAPADAGRFAVHRNNVVSTLANAIAERFPAVARIVGEEFFAAMARAFVSAHPPRSPVLHEYGADFPAFVEAFAPAADLSYLADVARLELARGAAWHAADAAPVTPEDLARVPAHALPGTRLRLHPSLSIVPSGHPVLTIWSMNSGGRTPELIVDWAPETVLVVRPHTDVLMRAIEPGEAAFIAAMAAGAALGAAVESAGVRDLAATFALLIETGAITAVVPPTPPEDSR